MSSVLKELSLRTSPVSLPLPIFTDEDFQYTTEARFGEIFRALSFCDSFESLTVRYSESDLSVESMANYHYTVGLLLDSTGVKLPVEAFAVSFEAAESDKESFGTKAKEVIAAILKWVREAIGKLKEWLTRSKSNAAAKTQVIKTKADGAKESIKEIKALGFTAVPPKPETLAAKVKPVEKPDDKTSVAASQVKEGVVERATRADRAKSRPTTPAYLLKSGKLDTSKIRKFLVDIGGLDVRALTQKAMAEDARSEGDIETFTKAWRTIFDNFQKPVGTAQLEDEGVDLGELDSLLNLVKEYADTLLKTAQDNQYALGKLEAAERELKSKVDGNPEDLAKDRKVLGKLLIVARDGQSFQNNLYTAVLSLANELGKIAEMGKRSVK